MSYRRAAIAPLLFLLASASSAPAAPVPLVCGDSNANGSVTSTDALSVLKKGVGQEATVLCCGDGIRSGNEECEGGDLAGDSCVSRGYGGGALRCSSACALDESGCWKSRFEDLGETVYDHETGLEWEKKDSDDGASDPANPHDVDNLYSWGDADPPYGPIGDAYTGFLARLNGAEDGKCYAGTCDWRMPTVDEWMSLVVPPIACDNASFCLTFFDPVLEPMKDDVYWSSSTNGDTPSEAFVMVIPDAVAKSDIKKESHFLRAVRMGLKKSS